MARIRSIHPGLFTDEGFASVSMAARVFYIGLLTEADDNGIMERKTRTLRARLLAFDNFLDGELLLEELEAANLVKAFSMDGTPFVAVKNFVKWQRPKKPKVTWEIPPEIQAYVRLDLRADDPETALRKRKCHEQGGQCAYCGAGITFYSKRANSLEIDHAIPRARGGSDEDYNLVAACLECNRSKGAMTAEEFREVLSSRRNLSSRNVPETNANIPENFPKTTFANQRKEEGGRRDIEGSLRSPSPREEAGTPAAPVRESPPDGSMAGDDGFTTFWAEYPAEARTAPDYARRAYAKALQLGATPEGILAALRREVAREGRKVMLSPAAWLKGGSWRMGEADEAPVPRAAQAVQDARFEGWELADRLALGQWRKARENGWLTPDARRNALPENQRRGDLWDSIQANRPRVAAFLRHHESNGLPMEVEAYGLV